MKIITGNLGWANPERVPKGGLEVYGPGGRWGDFGTGTRTGGDHLADALQREDMGEGTRLIVIAIPRFEKPTADEISEAVAEHMRDQP